MAEQEAMHIGRDGIDMKGYGSILIGVLILFMLTVGWMFSKHLDRDEQRNTLIEDRMESMRTDHASIGASIIAQTDATRALTDVLKEQNCILLADEKDTQRIRRAAQWSNEACRKIMMEVSK